MGRYDDMIHLPHPEPKKHPRMSLHDRAAQFSPFAALTGHSAAIDETARLTERRLELNEEKKADLDRKWQYLLRHRQEQPVVKLIYFIPDEKKEGGLYTTVKGLLKKIDEYKGMLVLENGTKIFVKDIFEMEIEQ